MANQWEVANDWEVADVASQWEPVIEEAPIRAPAIEVAPQSKDVTINKEVFGTNKPEVSSAGLFALGDVALGIPGWVVSTVGSLGHAALSQLTTKGPVDYSKSAQFGQHLAQKLSLTPEPGELMPGEYASKKLGLQKAYKESYPAKFMDAFGTAIDATAQEAQNLGIMDKNAAKIIIDSAMLFAPYAKAKGPYKETSKVSTDFVETPTEFTPVETKLPTSETTKVSESGVTVPKVTVEPKVFADSLYNIDNLYKLDLTESVNLDKTLKEMGVEIDSKNKMRRYDEGQALGNEKINNEVSGLQREVNNLFSENHRIFQENDFKSRLNPEGKVTSFKELPQEAKDTITSNYDRIQELRDAITEVESRRGTKEKLNPVESSIYSRYILPLRTEIRDISQRLMEKGKAEPRKLTEDFASRIESPAEKSVWQRTKEAIVGKEYDANEVGNVYLSAAAKGRGFYTLEQPRTGKRTTISISEPNKDGLVSVSEHVNKGIQRTFKVPEEIVRDSLENGTQFLGRDLKEATTAEINLNIGPKYVENYNAVLGTRLAQLRDQLRKSDWVDELVSSPEFSKIGIKLSDMPRWKDLPDGFRTLKYTDKMPELRDYAFENRYAEILDDYNKPSESNPLVRATNTLVTNMMLLPFVHMHNEGMHWAITKGLSGIGRSIVSPFKLKEVTKDFPSATKEVLERGPLFQEILREGGSIMSANIRNSNYIDRAFRESAKVLVETPKFKQIAKMLGRAPADLYAGLSTKSQEAMWTVRDILYTNLIIDKMSREGLSVKEAIDSVERHMPSYRLPSRLSTVEKAFGEKMARKTSQALNNRNVFMFSRYHHGMINSALNTAKDLAMLDKGVKKSKQFKEGVDSALAMWVAMAIVYPLVFDQMAQVVSDVLDQDGKVAEAKVRRPGVLHVFDSLSDVYQGKKDAYAASSILLTLNPILQAGIELAWNYELYNRKELINWKDSGSNIMKDYAEYMARRVPQFAQGVQATNEDYGTGWPGVILRNFFDIRTRTAEQIDREEKQVERKEAAAFNRDLGL